MSCSFSFHKKSSIYMYGLIVFSILMIAASYFEHFSFESIYNYGMGEMTVIVLGFIELFSNRNRYSRLGRVTIDIDSDGITLKTKTFFSGCVVEVIRFQSMNNIERLYYDAYGIEIEYVNSEMKTDMFRIHGLKDAHVFYKIFFDYYMKSHLVTDSKLLETRSKLRKIEPSLDKQILQRNVLKICFKVFLFIICFVAFAILNKYSNGDSVSFYALLLFVVFLIMTAPLFIYPYDLD